MADGNIVQAPDQIGPSEFEQKNITGTDLSGNKRGHDVAVLYDINAADQALVQSKILAQGILRDRLSGTLPRDVYDSFSLVVVGTTYTYTFTYLGIRQFIVAIADPTGDYTVTTTEINQALLEDSGAILLEDSGELHTEDG